MRECSEIGVRFARSPNKTANKDRLTFPAIGGCMTKDEIMDPWVYGLACVEVNAEVGYGQGGR